MQMYEASFHVDVLFAEYIEDLCPYATFQLNKQTYSESSYSGNVYSGPYHSVRGSFVYHENKNDSYRVSCRCMFALTIELHFAFHPPVNRAKNLNTPKFVELARGFATMNRKTFSSSSLIIPAPLIRKCGRYSRSTFPSPSTTHMDRSLTMSARESPSSSLNTNHKEVCNEAFSAHCAIRISEENN